MTQRYKRPLSKHYTTIIAGMFGNVLEWYDFALYGFLAIIIAELFFPPGDPVASLLATYGIFAAGFVARPLGAVIFGYIGDQFGRKPALLLSVLMMGVATTLLGVLPTYATVGALAPILLVGLRVIQGFSVGGEFSTSVTYMVEQADQNKRGLSGSFANIGSTAGMLLGAGIAAAATTFMSPDILQSWGWRLPFLFGGILAIIAMLLRRHLPSAVIHTEEKRHVAKTPLGTALTHNKRELSEAIAISLGYAVFFYLALVYLPTYADKFLHIPLDVALRINTGAIALGLLGIPFFGYISDRFVRRKTLLYIAFGGAAILSIPAFILFTDGNVYIFACVQIIAALIMSIPLGVAPATYVEMFPRIDRLTAYSVTFNVSLGIFGGTAPLIATYLIQVTNNELMPAFYLVATLLISLVGLTFMRDRSREALR